MLPACTPLIAPTREAAQAIQAARREQIGLQGAIKYLSGSFHGFDLRRYGLDDPFPLAAIESVAEGFKGNMTQMLRVARDEALTVRQFVLRFGFPKDQLRGHRRGRGRRDAGVDRAGSVRRLHAGRVPAGSAAPVRRAVAPILRERGLLRREYAGTTLRENLGLPRPANRFAAGTP